MKENSRKIQICTIDAFTSVPFSGNPAAVCLLEDDLDDDLKQKIAAEMNISETAFVTKINGNDFKTGNTFGLRWFTPTNEVPLCGHATLASAKALFAVAGNTNSIIEFSTLSGILKARRDGDKVVLDLPLNPPSPCGPAQFALLVKEVTQNLPVADLQLSETTKKLLIRLQDSVTREQLEELTPNTDRMMQLETSGQVKGVIVTVLSASRYNFISRYFAPWNGISEDPVTGSAHTVLGPYWAARLGSKSLTARQCSPRGGDLNLRIRDDGRIDVAGSAVLVLEGTITVG